MILSIDFESRSRVDLKRAGAYVYAQDPSTDLWCMAYAFDNEEPQLWAPGANRRCVECGGHGRGCWSCFPAWIEEHVHEGGEIRAWNAQFERLIWTHILGPRYGFPEPALEQWHCTAAEAAAMALPRSLDECARVLNVEQQKDDSGYRLMMQMAKPRKPTKTDPREWWDDGHRRGRLYEYCKQDVRTERAVARRLRRLSKREREVYLLDQRINDRGVRIDVPLVQAMQEAVGVGTERANGALAEVTGGAVASVTKVADLTRWLRSSGLGVDNVRKDTLRDLLAGDRLDATQREAIELRSEAGKSSVAKLSAALDAMCEDGYVRGTLLYHGASTGRWSGRLLQPQNFPRGTVKDAGRFVPLLLARDFDLLEMEEPLLSVVSSLLRGIIVPSRGCRLMVADFAQIEARVLAWIAGQDDLVRGFAQGSKIYEEMGAAYSGKPLAEIITDGEGSEERHVGKTSVLGAGYQMGADKFAYQVRQQSGIVLPRGGRDAKGELLPGQVDMAQRIIDTYRTRFARIPAFWCAINDAAVAAVQEPGTVTSVGRDDKIRFTVNGQFLWCVLPSGRPLCYSLPQLGWRETKWSTRKFGLSYCTVLNKPNMPKRWTRVHAYGGLLTENVAQAMARDLMAAAMLRLDAAGYPVVLTVHDEVVCDVPRDHGRLQDFVALMERLPRWAEGLPVAVKGYEGERYRK